MTNINKIHASQTTDSTALLTQRKYIKQEPYIKVTLLLTDVL